MRNRAGIIQRFPLGTDEVEYSNVTKTESRMGCGLGRGGHRPGIFQHPPREVSEIKKDSTEQKFVQSNIKWLTLDWGYLKSGKLNFFLSEFGELDLVVKRSLT